MVATLVLLCFLFFFFKQKTAYEMRISDWSSDVCSSDLCCHAISKLALTDRIGAIGMPTLIVVGEDDPGTPVSMHVTINEKIAGSELVILPTARHLSNIEAVEPFNAALLEIGRAHV